MIEGYFSVILKNNKQNYMIAKFRKGADNLLVRILLGLIALSFVGVGGAAFIKSNGGEDIVSFSHTDPISYEKFYTTRAKEIEHIQIQNGINLTEETIAHLDVNKSVLRKLINEAMISYLAKYYEFDISEKKIIDKTI